MGTFNTLLLPREARMGTFNSLLSYPGRLEWAHLTLSLPSWEARMGTFNTLSSLLGG